MASIASLIHDIAVIETKKSEGHAGKAEIYVRSIITRHNNSTSEGFLKLTKVEEDILINAIAQHIDKETKTDDPYVELLKDDDSIDRYLHGVNTEGAYRERYNKF